MKVIRKDLTCRVGMDHSGGVDEGPLFIRKLGNLDREIADVVCEQLGLEPEELFHQTCTIKKILGRRRGKPDEKQSITGDDYLAKIVLKLKLRVIIDECKLVKDREVKAQVAPDGLDDSDAE